MFRVFSYLLFLTLVLAPGSVFAAEIEVRSTILNISGSGHYGQATLQLEILNVSDQQLRALQIRPDDSFICALERTSLDLSELGAGEAFSGTVDVVVDRELIQSNGAIVWHVVFEREDDSRATLLISGSSNNRL
jgi:hypothetical protein